MPVRPWCPFALLLALAVPASAQVPTTSTDGALRPLIRLAGWESGCTREDAPDSCRHLLRDRLVEVFRDGRATGVSTALSDEAAPLSRAANGAIAPEALATLSATIAEAQLGTGGGSCDPYPESASFPQAASYDLLWFGRNGRYNVLVLTRGEAPCPDAVADVFNQLLVIADVGIVPGS